MTAKADNHKTDNSVSNIKTLAKVFTELAYPWYYYISQLLFL